jgi:WD40 repeat protein/DNA-binding SARP family transcriptional activator
VDSPDVGIGVLGPLTIDGAGPDSRIGPRDRMVLAALVTVGSEALRLERLAEAVWGECPPVSWRKVLHGCVARLRRVLGTAAIVTVPDGYRLAAAASEIDARCFEQLLGRARDQLALDAADRALFLAGEALALWRGPALPELEGWEPGRVEAGRLEELRRDAEELRVEAAVRAGRQSEVLADAQAQVVAAPLRERRWVLLAQAQYGAGRQGEALASLRRARQVLTAELGLDPGPELAGVERAILRQDPSLGPPEQRPPHGSAACPYPGLVPYDVDDAETFFGRDDDIAQCLRRLATAGVLVVVGASGSGKSSLVRAGVAAALRAQGRPVTVVHPGPHPMRSLSVLPESGPAPALVVDQCEEVLTLCTEPAEQGEFITALAGYPARSPLVVALRADRLGEICEHAGFARLVENGLYLLSSMREGQVRTAIEGPARQTGLLLEPGLVDLLQRDVDCEPGPLPLLSHALRQTWRRREGRTLTVAGYRATGGIRGAVANTAEDLYERTPVAFRPLLRDLLLRLVAVTPEGEANRGRIPRRLIATGPAQEQLLERLVAARLVTADEDTVALAHEALTRVWPRMRAWLDEDAEGQRIRRHLSFAADAWEAMSRPDSELYRGARLARAAEWRERSAPSLSAAEDAFLTAAGRLADAERALTARTNRRLRTLLTVALVLLVAAGGAGVYALRQAGRAGDAALSAEARRISALAQTTANADKSLLLAAGAIRMDDTAATRAGLLAVLGRDPQLIRVLGGPEREAGRLAVSADGTTLLVLNGTRAGLFDTRTHAGTWRPPAVAAEDLPTTAAAIRPDGGQIAIPYGPIERPAVRLIDVGTGLVRTIRPVRLPFDCDAKAVAYSADGRLLAVAYRRDQYEYEYTHVRIWQTGAVDRPPTTLNAPWLTDLIRFSPDGRMLYTAGNGRLSVFDAVTGRLVRSTALTGLALDLSPDGRLLATASPRSGEVVLSDAASGAVRARLAASGAGLVQQVRFSADGRLLAAATADNTTTVFVTATGRSAELLQGHANTVVDLAFGRDGATLYTSDRDGTTLVWDLRGDRRFVARRVVAGPGNAPITSAVIAPDGSAAAFVSVRAGPGGRPHSSLRVTDLAGGRTRTLVDVGPGRYPGVAWRPDGARLATTDGQGRVRVWDAVTGQRLADRQVSHTAVHGVVYSRDGSRLIVTDDRVLELDGQSLRTLTDQLRLPGEVPWRPVLSPDGRTLVALDFVPAEAVPPEAARSIAYADLDRARARDLPVGVAGAAAIFAPDGRRLAVGGHAGDLVLIDTGNGLALRSPVIAHDGPAGPLAYSADGRTVVAGGPDGQVSVWDGRTGELLGVITPAAPGVHTYPAFQPDGHTVVIASSDGTVHIWDTRPAEWIAYACRVAGRDLTAAERTEAAGEHAPAAAC